MNRRDLIKSLGATATSVYLLPDLVFRTQIAYEVRHSAALPRAQRVSTHSDSEVVPDEMWRSILSQMVTTSTGRVLAVLIDRNREEIRTLLSVNPRVAVIWWNINGLEWTEKVFRCLHARTTACPREIAGVTLREAVQRLTLALTKHGSPRLAEDIPFIANELMRLPGSSYEFLLEAWRHEPDALTNAASSYS